QIVGETYNFMEQQLLLDIIINLDPGETIDVDELKKGVHEYAEQVIDDEDEKKGNFNELRDALKARCIVEGAEKDVEKRVDAVANEAKEEPEEKRADAKTDPEASEDGNKGETPKPPEKPADDNAEKPADEKPKPEKPK